MRKGENVKVGTCTNILENFDEISEKIGKDSLINLVNTKKIKWFCMQNRGQVLKIF